MPKTFPGTLSEANVGVRIDKRKLKADLVDVEKEVKKSGKKSAEGFSKEFSDMHNKAMGKLAGMLSVGAGVAAVVQGFRMWHQSMADIRRETVALELSLRPLLSLGDNLSISDSIRSKVLSTSSGSGVNRQQVNQALFNLQSGASSLSQQTQAEIFNKSMIDAKVTGADLDASINLLIKTYMAYGDQVESVAEMNAKLNRTADQGSTNFQEMAVLLPDLASGAAALGIRFEDLLGMLVPLTQALGNNNKTFTGLRNILLRYEKAGELGINTSKGLLSVMEELAEADGMKVKEIFGDEAFAVAAAFSSKIVEIRDAIKDIEAVPADMMEAKLGKLLSDPKSLNADTLQKLETAFENQLADKSVSDYSIKTLIDEQAIRASTQGTPFEILAGPLATLAKGFDMMGMDVLVGDRKRYLQDRMVDVRKAEGRDAALIFGKRTGLTTADNLPSEAEAVALAEKLAEMRETQKPRIIASKKETAATLSVADALEQQEKQIKESLESQRQQTSAMKDLARLAEEEVSEKKAKKEKSALEIAMKEKADEAKAKEVDDLKSKMLGGTMGMTDEEYRKKWADFRVRQLADYEGRRSTFAMTHAQIGGDVPDNNVAADQVTRDGFAAKRARIIAGMRSRKSYESGGFAAGALLSGEPAIGMGGHSTMDGFLSSADRTSKEMNTMQAVWAGALGGGAPAPPTRTINIERANFAPPYEHVNFRSALEAQFAGGM